MLIPVRLLANLKLRDQQVPGALNRAWLHPEIESRLLRANEIVRNQTGGKAEILVWEAQRSMVTEDFLFARERRHFLHHHPELIGDQADSRFLQYYGRPNPDAPPPHVTGGAVDVTLLWDGDEESLGQFDDCSSRRRADYYAVQPPETASEALISYRRSVLIDAMKNAGFVQLESEWFHFEFGTDLWARETGMTAFLNRMLTPPATESVAEGLVQIPSKQTQLIHGVAHAFPSPQARNDAILRRRNGFFYARPGTPTGAELADRLCRLLECEDCLLVASGLRGAILAASSYMTPGGTLVMDENCYYEVGASLRDLSRREGWRVVALDLSSEAALSQLALLDFEVLYCDHPRNWVLTCPNLRRLRALSEAASAKLIVDVSVQPLQRLFRLGLADLEVMSLSKYPSLGETMGGAILGSEADLKPLRARARLAGDVLAPQVAERILTHLPSLRDRLLAVSEKAQRVAEALRQHSMIGAVSIPDLSAVGAVCGGQICAHFINPSDADAVEDKVGENAAFPGFPLALACTFGASFTIIEHFYSRNWDRVEPVIGSDVIKPGWMRISIGLESAEDIIRAFAMVLRFAETQTRGPGDRAHDQAFWLSLNDKGSPSD
jgi:cystathionine beta-lyase/cystathionine gamma-synthase